MLAADTPAPAAKRACTSSSPEEDSTPTATSKSEHPQWAAQMVQRHHHYDPCTGPAEADAGALAAEDPRTGSPAAAGAGAVATEAARTSPHSPPASSQPHGCAAPDPQQQSSQRSLGKPPEQPRQQSRPTSSQHARGTTRKRGSCQTAPVQMHPLRLRQASPHATAGSACRRSAPASPDATASSARRRSAAPWHPQPAHHDS